MRTGGCAAGTDQKARELRGLFLWALPVVGQRRVTLPQSDLA
jgi:hypothetical protein